jgi:type IV pilus assembly protein PilA
MKKGNHRKNDNKGFSLVELIVVIAIMAVLVGVLAPQFMGYVEKSREATDIQNLSSVGTALQTYCAEHTITNSLTVTLGTAVPSTDTDTLAALTNAGYSATVALKGTASGWAPSVTYNPSTNTLTYDGSSDYYEPTSDKTGFTAK